MSYKTLNKLEQVKEAAEQIPEKFGELPHKIDSGRMKINKAWKQVQNHKKKQELIAQASKVNLSDIATDNSDIVESTDGKQQIIVATTTTTQPASPSSLLEKDKFDIANNRLKILAAQLREQSNFNNISSEEKEVP